MSNNKKCASTAIGTRIVVAQKFATSIRRWMTA